MAQALVPTSLFRIQDLKTHTEKIQVYFAFLLLIYSPNLSSHSAAFPSATIYTRMFFPSLNNDRDCQGTAKFRELKLRENITGCTANHNSWARRGSGVTPTGTGTWERIGAHISALPGQGPAWQLPPQPRLGTPPTGSADHPSGCSGTCSTGQRSIPRPKGSG